MSMRKSPCLRSGHQVRNLASYKSWGYPRTLPHVDNGEKEVVELSGGAKDVYARRFSVFPSISSLQNGRPRFRTRGSPLWRCLRSYDITCTLMYTERYTCPSETVTARVYSPDLAPLSA